MKKVLLATALLLPFGGLQAAETISWDYAGVSYQQKDVLGEDFKGLGFTGSKLLGNSNFFVNGSLSFTSADDEFFGETIDYDFNTISAGLGYRHSVSKTTDVFGVVSYEDAEIEVSYAGESESESEDGHSFKVGLRSLVTDSFELSGSINYVTFEESETGFTLSAMYHINHIVSVNVGYDKLDDLKTTSLGAVFFF